MRFASFRRLRPLHVAAFLIAAAIPATAELHVVNQVGLVFSPENITVAPGDTVRWVWGSGTHTVTSGDNCTYDGLYFDAPLTSSQPTFDWVVPSGVSEVPYYCRPHCFLGMVGTITIVEPADPINFVITIDGDQSVPPNASEAAGSGTATLAPDTKVFSWDFSYSGLEGTETAAHFHGAAAACETAGIQVTLATGSPKVGSTTLTDAQIADLLAGLWYVNIHTNLYPGGEIRGQVMPTPLLDPIPDNITTGDIEISLIPVATGFTAPNWAIAAPGHASRLYVSDQSGIVWAVNLNNGNKSVFLDASAQLVPLGVFGAGSYDERGLLGIAFHPDYLTNGLLYTYTSQPVDGLADFTTLPGGTGADHQSVVTEWHVPTPADPGAVVDPGSARQVLRVDQPQFNHNAGALAFGPDGLLYVAFGDGGGGDDHDGQLIFGSPMLGHGCLGNGADTDTILGTIIRIDPLGTDSANGEYGIPADNPFVGTAGLDEIFAYGFRNPFRFSFDSATGDLWGPDVGQNAVEELNVVTAGGNYGWRYKEGSFYFVFNGNQPGYVTDVPLDVPAGLIDPIAEYDHDDGLAVVGGFVYRGVQTPALAGRYVFGDFARTFSSDGRLFYLDAANAIRELTIQGQPGGLGYALMGFGQDTNGELYVLGNTTGVPSGTTGVVLRIAPPLCAGDVNCDGIVDYADIDVFVAALGCVGGDPACWPPAGVAEICPWLNADCDHDGDVTYFDIDPFVARIGSTCPQAQR